MRIMVLGLRGIRGDQAAAASGSAPAGRGDSERAREGRNAAAIRAPTTAIAAAMPAVVDIASTNAWLAVAISSAPDVPPTCAPTCWAAPTLSPAAAAASGERPATAPSIVPA